MTLARPKPFKVLVVSKSGDLARARTVFEEIVEQYPKLIAIVGEDCRVLEDLCDEICERTEAGLNICTTSHPDEPLSEVIEFVETYDHGEYGSEYLNVTI